MHRRTFVALIPFVSVAAVCLAGCAQQPRVKVQPTPGTDFSKYHTYAIRPGNIVYPGASEAERSQIEQRIQDAVARELEGRGLTPLPDEPEVIVTYTAGAQQRDPKLANAARAAEGVDIREPGGNPYDEPGLVRAREGPDPAAEQDMRRRFVEGNLVLDLLDGKTRRLVWRATANLELMSDRSGRLIDSVVRRAFAQLPQTTPAPE